MRIAVNDGTPKSCPMSAEVTALMLGETAGAEAARVEAHLAECPACRREADETRALLTRLRSLPQERVTRDLAPEILSRIPVRQWAPSLRILGLPVAYAWAAAAAVVLLIGGIAPFVRSARHAAPSPAPEAMTSDTAMDRAVVWLCRTQEPDGSWSTEKWGGNEQFGVALTALSLLALIDGTSGVTAPERLAAIRRAVGCLVKQQNAIGEFGPRFGSSPYNQGMATLALLKAYQRVNDSALRGPLDRAIGVICSRQTPQGGWGYQAGAAPVPNLSITLWQVQALRLAAKLGWDDVQSNLDRGLAWIASVADDEGAFGYTQAGDFPQGSETLTAMGALSLLDRGDERFMTPAQMNAIRARLMRMAADEQVTDYYRGYFLSEALKRVGGDAASRHLDALRWELAQSQVLRGPLSGTWEESDPWSGTGGRIYRTAMATLSLRPSL